MKKVYCGDDLMKIINRTFVIADLVTWSFCILLLSLINNLNYQLYF